MPYFCGIGILWLLWTAYLYVGWCSESVPWSGIFSWTRKPASALYYSHKSKMRAKLYT